MKKIFTLLFAVALLAPSLANASDMRYIKRLAKKDVSPHFSWSGFYIGGQIGYSSGSDTNDCYQSQSTSQPYGGILGLYGGYNYSLSKNWLLGIEAELNYKGMRGDFTYPSSSEITSQFMAAKWNGSTRLRLGYKKGRYLPYLTIGDAFMMMDLDLQIKTNTGTPLEVFGDFSFVGLTIGAGLDYALTNNWILRADYRYTDFGKKDFFYTDVNNNGSLKYAFQKTLQSRDLRFGVSYKF